MKDLQELIGLLRLEKEKAHSQYKSEEIGSLEERYLLGKFAAFSLSVDKAELLLAQQSNSKIAPPLQQAGVSGWLELAEQQPKENQKIVLHSKAYNSCSIDNYNPEEFPDNLKYSYRWIPVPAIR